MHPDHLSEQEVSALKGKADLVTQVVAKYGLDLGFFSIHDKSLNEKRDESWTWGLGMSQPKA